MSLTEHFRIRLTSLHPSKPIPFDIFIHVGSRMVHYLRAGDSISQEKLLSFESKAPDKFFITEDQKPTYQEYIKDRLSSDQLSAKEKALMLRESSLALVEALYEHPDVGKALQDAKEVIFNFVNLMDSEPESLAHLIGLSTHDFYTYNHSLDVSIYSLGLGQAAGFSAEDLKTLGEGSLFHDIGKRHVPVDIICKDGPLDDGEWAQMQKHPEYGLHILTEHSAADAIKACCFEHHESFTGNGYPQKLAGHEIHPMARIVAITDTYDALTTQRSYNVPMTPRNALEFMNNKLKGRYDNDLMRAMYEVLFKMEKEIKS